MHRHFLPVLCLFCLLPVGCLRKEAELAPSAATAGVAGPAPARPVAPLPQQRPAQSPQPSRPAIERAVAPALVSTEPSDRKNPAQRTAAEIVGRYAIAMPSPDVLVVRRTDVKPQAPSLFEESIALANVRTRLKSSPDFPPALSEKSRLINGTAIIPFNTTVPPDRAADAIMRILAVNGVQSVRAVFSDAR